MESRVYRGDDENAKHRYSGRVFGYPLTHERVLSRVSGGSRSLAPPSEPKGNDQDSEQDIQPRRRIPVACGRCRKRKIRCSGDPGNGGSCENCRLANIDTCAFLRVSSTETSFKGDASDFAYDTASSRAHCRIPMGGGYSQGYSPLSAVSPDNINAYRQNTIGGLSLPVRSMYQVPSTYGPYTESHVDYGMHSMSPLPDYLASQGSRSWASNERLANGLAYNSLDDGHYNNPTQYPTDALPVRRHNSQEHKGYSINVVSPMISNASVVNNNRLLPIPIQRPGQIDSFVRGDSSVQGSLPGSAQSSFSGMMGANMRTMSALSLSDNQSTQSQQTSYLAQSDSSGAENDHQPPLSYGTHGHTVPMHHQHQSAHWAQDGLYPSNSSSADLSYYTSTSEASRKHSQSDQSHSDASLPPLSNHGSVHTYTPLPVQPLPSHMTFPHPPMDPQALEPLRRANGVSTM